MENQGILLSICIPTYRRGSLLRQTLDSIVVQDVFRDTSSIEVIVSDNCSPDDTEEVMQPFVDAFPGKIHYHRHPKTGTMDENFIYVLKQGRGAFLKLHNDNLTFRNGALSEMVRVIEATRPERPVLFFTNNHQRLDAPIEAVGTLSDFVRRVSIYATWIGGFGIWRDDLAAMPDFARYEHLKLVQTDVVLRLIAGGRRAILLFEQYFVQLNPGRKGGYNTAEVFGNNYLTLLKEYLATGQLDPAVYAAEKREALVQLVLPLYFNPNHDFQRTGFFIHLRDYLDEPYFHEALQQLSAKGVPIPVPPLPGTPPGTPPRLDRIGILNAYWRERHAHNATWLARVPASFDPDTVDVGRKSRGAISLSAPDRGVGRLAIGHFVSIAEDVTFVLDDDGACDRLSTYPFAGGHVGVRPNAPPRNITIGDDVRIGFGATIEGGVTVGQGAIVGAGSVVADDVPPYAIVAGNPARVTGLRYQRKVVDKMTGFDFGRLDDATILANRELLDTALTPDNVDTVLARLRG